ncbi:MAG: phospholipid/cholesterol/gamma-HCH transport system substrate-binding protein [Actinomycetota bacterium]|jgi:phospholipid/cholesterol/gamma-HCH transport system substrate-binding protein|nr:phospholipid/cholesterol/gamma-HCH transport system substrate-binding protein [Actinomycetota bacterium]
MRFSCLLVVFAALVSACGGPGANDADVIAYFEDVGDLVSGGQVQVNDVEVGRIDGIDLVTRDGHMMAKVSMSLDPGTRVSADGLGAVVRQTSLLGEQFVQLLPSGEGPPFVGDRQVEVPIEMTDRRVDVETFLSDLSTFVGGGGLEDLNRFTHAQALILEDRGRRFGQTLDELERFTSVLANRRVDVGAAIDALASASGTIASNKETLDSFLDSLDEANALLAEQGDQLGRLFSSLRRFGTVSSRFLAQHESAIDRQFKALRPILAGLAGAQGALRNDISQLRTFLELFPQSMGGGPGGKGKGDYIQVEAVLCEALASCHTKGEKGDVPGEGS